MHVCRWYSQQQDIQHWIKHAIVMTECFSQLGRKEALGLWGENRHKKNTDTITILFAKLDLSPVTLIPPTRRCLSCHRKFGYFPVTLSRGSVSSVTKGQQADFSLRRGGLHVGLLSEAKRSKNKR